MIADERGPGHTQFVAEEDGSISVRRWNDPAWTNRFVLKGEFGAHSISAALNHAYRMGMEDKASIIKQAIGF